MLAHGGRDTQTQVQAEARREHWVSVILHSVF